MTSFPATPIAAALLAAGLLALAPAEGGAPSPRLAVATPDGARLVIEGGRFRATDAAGRVRADRPASEADAYAVARAAREVAGLAPGGRLSF